MEPCRRVGIDTTYRCNWRCSHCFYRRSGMLRRPVDVPLDEIRLKIRDAKRGGCDHVVMVGYGEPSLDPRTPEILDFAHGEGMATSMITNGATGLERFQGFFDQGLDHLHISSHGSKDMLTAITQDNHAWEKQHKLKGWLKGAGLPFRNNVSMQRLNYRQLRHLARYEVAMGIYHFVFLGFLPHYEWGKNGDYIRAVAVPPAMLRPQIEEAADVLLKSGTLFTIRYHPFCHLRPDLWKYVVNARYVFFDSTEWNYTLQVHDRESLWKASVDCGEAVAIRGEPCSRCAARRHCGGWNRVCAQAFGGADLEPIEESAVPAEYHGVWDLDGGLHDLNPATRIPSRIRQCQTATP